MKKEKNVNSIKSLKVVKESLQQQSERREKELPHAFIIINIIRITIFIIITS